MPLLRSGLYQARQFKGHRLAMRIWRDEKFDSWWYGVQVAADHTRRTARERLPLFPDQYRLLEPASSWVRCLNGVLRQRESNAANQTVLEGSASRWFRTITTLCYSCGLRSSREVVMYHQRSDNQRDQNSSTQTSGMVLLAYEIHRRPMPCDCVLTDLTTKLSHQFL